VLGSGPSLLTEDVQRAALAAAAGRIELVAVNRSWELAPQASLLYGADYDWWDDNQGIPAFRGEKWTQDKEGGVACARRWGLACIRSELRDGMSFDPGLVHQGYHSGYQLVNLVVLFGVWRILLLGFDCQSTGGKRHYFGDHQGRLNKAAPYLEWQAAWKRAAPQLAAAGVEVINCSRQTALARLL